MSVSYRRPGFCIFALLLWATHTTVQADSAVAPHAARRSAVLAKNGTGLAVIPSRLSGAQGPQDNKGFFYLTGIAQPDAVLILLGEGDKREILFNRTGKLAPGSDPGIPDVRPVSELRTFLPRAIRDRNVYLSIAGLEGILQTIGGSNVVAGAAAILPLDPILAPMRMVKSPDEIQTLQKAIEITTEAYVEVLKAVQAGMTEKDIERMMALPSPFNQLIK